MTERRKKLLHDLSLAVGIIVVILGLAYGCPGGADDSHNQPAAALTALARASAAATIGDPTRSPDLVIVEEPWGQSGLSGLRGGNWLISWTLVVEGDFWNKAFGIQPGVRRIMRYECPIANIAEVTGTDTSRFDFVSDRSVDGILDSIYLHDYDFPGMLSLELFVGGTERAGYKQNFYVQNTHCFNYFCPEYRFYDGDTMYISVTAADFYRNAIDITGIQGYALLEVKINPDSLIHEQRYDNNEALLPMRIDSVEPYVTVDWAAVQDNMPDPPQGLTGSRISPKLILLTWTNPGEYEIQRDDGAFASLIGTSYVDTVRPNRKTVQYQVRGVNDIGESSWSTITVSRR